MILLVMEINCILVYCYLDVYSQALGFSFKRSRLRFGMEDKNHIYKLEFIALILRNILNLKI